MSYPEFAVPSETSKYRGITRIDALSDQTKMALFVNKTPVTLSKHESKDWII